MTDRPRVESRLLSSVRRVAADPYRRLALFAVISLVAAWPYAELATGLNGFRDAQVIDAYEEHAVMTISEHHEVPLWDPYYCGGIYAWGSPQARVPSPTTLLALLVGVPASNVLVAFLFVLLGMEGFFRYAREHAGSALGPAIMAPVFGLQGFFASLLPQGWTNFYSFALVPWVLYATRLTARGRPAGPLLLALGFAVMNGMGGSYAVVFAGLAAIAEGLRLLFERRRDRRQLGAAAFALALAAVLALAASAFRVWPITETIVTAPRVMLGTPGSPPTALFTRLAWTLYLHPFAELDFAGSFHIFLAALIPGLFALHRRRIRFPLFMVGLTFWLAMGYYPIVSAFAALRSLPVLETLRYPERFLILAILYGAVCSAVGITEMLRWARRGRKQTLLALAATVLALCAIPVQLASSFAASENMWISPRPEGTSRSFRQARGNRRVAALFAHLDRGSLSCWDAYPVPQSALLRGDLPAEEYLVDAEAGSVTRTAWSPNTITVRAELTRPARLRVNQNWHHGWSSDVGEVVFDEGLLAVELPAGDSEVRLSFLPRSAWGGTLISLVALLGLGWMASRQRLALRPLAITTAAPLVTLAAIFVLSSGTPPRVAPPTNPNGVPALADAPPDRSAPIGVRFEEPIELVAAFVPEAVRRRQEIEIELDWRRDGDFDRDLALVSLHLEGPDDAVRDVNREAIASSFRPSALPEGVLVRDIFGVSLDYPQPAGTWQAYVLLLDAGTPVPLADGEAAQSDRVLIGSFELE